MKKLIALFLQIVIVFSLIPNVWAADKGISVIINGQTVSFTEDSGYPYVDENYRTMVPLRATMEAAGATVGYDPNSQTAIVIMDHDRIEVPLGTDYLFNNNVKIQNDTVAVAKNGRTYLPIRAVLESAGYTVEWNGDTNSVVAYNFSFNEDQLIPYNTSNLTTLISEVLAGNVVYINGQYYATPDYMKMLANVQVHYSGDDLNVAIYPLQGQHGVSPGIEELPKLSERAKEWVTDWELSDLDITFQVFVHDVISRKGFYTLGIVSSSLYEMPSVPDDFLKAPYPGTFDGIQIRVENGEVQFKQSDLIAHGILSEEITEYVMYQ